MYQKRIIGFIIFIFSRRWLDFCLIACIACQLSVAGETYQFFFSLALILLQVKFREFIPSILNVSRQCLAAGEEDVAVIAFEIFDELIESPAPLLGESIKSIVQFSLEVCSSQSLESNTRHQVSFKG